MKKKISLLAILLISIFGFSTLFVSCMNDDDIEIDGTITYGTGSYAQVKYITFTVSGGTGSYKLYYARSINDWDYAKSNRSYIGTASEGETYTYNVDGYVSTGWYYYIWAVDGNGSSGSARWHP